MKILINVFAAVGVLSTMVWLFWAGHWWGWWSSAYCWCLGWYINAYTYFFDRKGWKRWQEENKQYKIQKMDGDHK